MCAGSRKPWPTSGARRHNTLPAAGGRFGFTRTKPTSRRTGGVHTSRFCTTARADHLPLTRTMLGSPTAGTRSSIPYTLKPNRVNTQAKNRREKTGSRTLTGQNPGCFRDSRDQQRHGRENSPSHSKAGGTCQKARHRLFERRRPRRRSLHGFGHHAGLRRTTQTEMDRVRFEPGILLLGDHAAEHVPSRPVGEWIEMDRRTATRRESIR